MALIPVGLVIIPLNKLTILLLLVLAADVAVALLLAEALRQFRPAYRTRGPRQPFYRVCHWTAATTRANQMAVNFEVAELDDQTMNAASMRRIGILHDYEAADPEGKTQIGAFREELRKLGWIEGENLQIQYRSAAVEGDLVRKAAAELIMLKPDVVLGAGGTIVAALQRASGSTPIVFVNVTDPVGGGLVASLARPGGNTTGFTQFEFGLSEAGDQTSANRIS